MSIWNELNEPDDFKSDWYGELTNQCSHTLLGLLSVIAFTFIWREVVGEMPYRWVAAVICVPAYIIIIECFTQGWRSGDSWFDSAMFAFGVITPLLAFSEVSFVGDVTILELNHRLSSLSIIVWFISLGFRVFKRWNFSISTGKPVMPIFRTSHIVQENHSSGGDHRESDLPNPSGDRFTDNQCSGISVNADLHIQATGKKE